MDHVVFVDAKAKELSKLINGEKTMLIRGAAGRKLPHGRVEANDVLYLIENDGSGLIKAKCRVKSVISSEKMSKEESIALVNENQLKLQLTAAQIKRWAGKRYLVLIEVDQIEPLTPFQIDKSDYGNMDAWLPVGEIDSVKK
ncbi:MAG: hypothetical protein ISR58_11595 [Anaerolineales bacterium]|nr:hypothetical protein [Chloroflexota bacterium]MBL6981819.1 hypothetical protein [Anaerolineales bacterium]